MSTKRVKPVKSPPPGPPARPSGQQNRCCPKPVRAVIHACGPAAQALAERFAACVREWSRHVCHTGCPGLTVHPAGTPDGELPPGDVLDKPASRLVFQWQGRTTSTQVLVPAVDQRD
ncbi:hypothetical protein ACIBVL_36695 [Streptomyces sp. NPDC049687]|uniref:hypothetical protein n=1 Tax=Streptomyces sp. NPDC049687 TaxID=3365596 RepID=UPI0037938CDA